MEGSRLIRKPADLMKGKTAKEPGSIAVYSGSIRWEPAPGSDAEGISVQLASITGKLQKAKGAAVMRVPLQSRSLVFGFQSVDDRESVLDVLNQCLAALPSAPAAAGASGAAAAAVPGIQASAEELQLLQKVVLQEHADVRKLYQSLVEGGVLSAGEFWKGKVALLQQEASRRRSGQCAGLSSSMLASLPGTMDGNANTLQFKVSPEMVRQIFVEKPSVHRAYIANVPRSMTEKEFWTRYFRYMKALQERRHSSATGTLTASHALQGEDELLFKRHEKEQEDRERASQRLRSVDPTVDLAADGFDSVGAGYGMAHRPHGRETAAGRAADIMGDLNRHANAVIDGVPAELRSKAAASTDETAQAVSAAMKKAVAADAAASQNAGGRARARQALEMPDLQPPEAVRYSELTIADPSRYFSTKSNAVPAVKQEAGELPGWPGAGAPERLSSGAGSDGAAAPEEQMALSLDLLLQPDRPLGCRQGQHTMQAIHAMLHGKPDEEDSFASGTSSIHSASALSRVIPTEVIEMERARALAINELLRHFYGALPGGRSRKLARLHEALVGEDVKIKSFQDALPGQQRHAFTRLLRPLCAALDVAFQKYQAVEQRASKESARKPA